MAARIDRIAAIGLVAAAFFLFFRAAFGSIVPALGLTAIALTLLRTVYLTGKRRFGRARARRLAREKAARALVRAWAFTPDTVLAKKHLMAAYPQQADVNVVLLPLHTAAPSLDAGHLLNLWRARRGQNRLAVLTTGSVDAAARALVPTLDHPQVALLDGKELASVLVKSALPLPDSPEKPAKRRFALPKPNRKRAPVCALYGLLMLGMYWLLGRNLYLVIALVLLGLSALGMRRAKAPSALFD